jgi:hypothetical protein
MHPISDGSQLQIADEASEKRNYTLEGNIRGVAFWE